MEINNIISKFDKYINNVLFTWGGKNELERALYGLFEEAGEIVGKEKKRLRGDFVNMLGDEVSEEFNEQVKKEIGDFLYYLRLYGHLNSVKIDAKNVDISFSFMAFQLWFTHDYAKFIEEPKHFYNQMFYNIIYLIEYLNFDFEEILKMNVDKLKNRLKNGTIKGNGDNR